MTTSKRTRLGEAPEEGIKAPVVTVSTGQETLFGIGQTIASVVIADMDRVAVAAQDDSTENGIYVARGGKSWERATDMNLSDDVANGQLMTDSSTLGVYSITSSVTPWTPGTDTISFGLLLSPVGFFWGAITGTLSNQGDLQLELDAKAALVHTHLEADITDLQAYITDAAGSIAMDGEFYARRNAAWEVIDFSVFAAAVHTHVEADILDLQPYLLDAAGSIAMNDELYARANGGWQAFSTASGTVGEIIAWPDTDPPENFLICDGSSQNAVTFADLFAVCGYKYGGSGANFNLPDLRGTFVRGTAAGSGNDPGRTLRTDRGDGATGDVVGTKQATSRLTTGPLDTVSGVIGGLDDHPINVGLNYIIRFTGGGSGITQPPTIEVQDSGVPLTTAAQLFNFINFELDNSAVVDEIDISFGVSKAAGQYCPDYAFNFISISSWSIIGNDQSGQFHAGRRLRFVEGAALYHGTIISSTFAGGDTVMTMSMEGGDDLTAGITEVCMVSSATSFAPISEDPFDGNSINDACVGDIAGTTYIFAVGDGGRAMYSSNGGLNWTLLSTATAENLNVCVYDSGNEQFWGGGDAGVLIDWDGATLSLDTNSIPALAGTSTFNINGFAYWTSEDDLVCLYQNTGIAWSTAQSADQGATWTARASLGNIPAGVQNLKAYESAVGVFGSNAYACIILNTSSRVITSPSDTSFASGDSIGSGNVPISMGLFHDGDVNSRVYGLANGEVIGLTSWLGDDDVTFSEPIRNFAWSSLHDRLLCCGDNQTMGYLDKADQDVNNAWTGIGSGFDPLANITTVVWDPTNGVFVAFGDNGQVCRDSNGTGDSLVLNPPAPHTGFTLIAGDPMTGSAINDIAVGTIGGTVYWVICGSGGQIFTSTDAGATWQSRASGLTANLVTIGFDAAGEQFMVGGGAGEFSTTTDGTTWTGDTTSVPAIPGNAGGSFNISQVTFDDIAGLWWINYAEATVNKGTATADPVDLLTWTQRNSNQPTAYASSFGFFNNDNTQRIYIDEFDDVYVYQGATDATASPVITDGNLSTVTAGYAKVGTNGNPIDFIIGTADGDLTMADTVVRAAHLGAMSGPVRGVAFTSVNNRYIAVGDGNEIYALESTATEVSNAWIEVLNPFTADILAIAYDASDDIIIAVGSNGEIGRSVDGIS